MLDLDPTYLATVKNILQTYAQGSTVWAYGSRVKGTAHEGSDLDLVIVGGTDDFQTTSTLRRIFSESNLPILVDIVNWSDIPLTFKEEIEKAHEVLQ